MTKSPQAVGLAPKSDMTPMIDVVFLMIVFFLCLPFQKLESKWSSFLPKDRGIGPSKIEPVEQLSVAVFCTDFGERRYDDHWRPDRFRLEGHGVRWEVGPTRAGSVAELRTELERIAASPASWVPHPYLPDPVRVSCVIEPYPGTVYEDVARTGDIVRACGFPDVNYGGGLGARPR